MLKMLTIQINYGYLQIGYEDTFYNSFNGGTSEIDSYIAAMMTHLQAFFCLDSLGTKIQVEVKKELYITLY